MASHRQTPWLNNLRRKNYASVETRLEDEIWAYVDYMAPTTEEEVVVNHVGKYVRDTLRPVFPGCKIHTSGSTSTGLRLPRSDVDLVIEMDEDSETDEEMSVTDGLVELADLVRREGWVEHVDEILDARVPIIKISTTHEFGSLNFDVGINNISGLKNNEWVKKRLGTMPALKALVLIIRGALSQRGLNDASQHGLSSFAVVCMCVFFLQNNPYEIPKSHLAFPKRKKSLCAILKGFLLYYSRDVPFEGWYISVSRGKLVKKPKRGVGRLIHRRCYGNLVIQCPTDYARNITASLSMEKFEEIRGVFGGALEGIRNVEKSCRNILGSLVSVDQRFMEYRREIRQLVRSGQLLENIQSYEAESEDSDDEGECSEESEDSEDEGEYSEEFW